MLLHNWKYLDVATLDFEDKKTWELLQRGDTDGVFQLESAGMKETCQRVKPNCMDDLIAILALYRPDTMRELEHYIRRKHGLEEITYIHPDLEPILKETYGTLIYQEQILKITRVFAGFNDAEADTFRRGIGKKDPKLVREQSEKFHARCLEKGYSKEVADHLAGILEAMGGYSFNKAHATAYAITSYKTAYLKANYPVEFMCALMRNQKKPDGKGLDYDSLGLYLIKCKEMGIKVSPPDVNHSDDDFIIKDGEILFGLQFIKGVGKNVVDAIKELRPFSSFEDFLDKMTEAKVLNKTSIISLIKAGAFNFTGQSKHNILLQYGKYRWENGQDAIKPLRSINKNHIQQMIDAGIISVYEKDNKAYCLNKCNEWRMKQHLDEWTASVMVGDELEWEYESLSVHLSGDPTEGVELPPWDSFEEGGLAFVAGTIISLRELSTKSKQQMAFGQISTPEGIRELVIFPKHWELQRKRIVKGASLVVRGEKQGEKLLVNGSMSVDKYKEIGA